MTNKERVLSISKELGLTHIGSNLSCLPVLEEIYAIKKPEDVVILDNGHAGLSHLIIKEYYESLPGTVEELIKENIHCDRLSGCDASTGSLGHGIGIAIGYALVDKKRDVYVVVSDGSVQEGSTYEALRIASELGLKNLHIHCNFNSYTALAKVDPNVTYVRMLTFYDDVTLHLTTNTRQYDGVKGHYLKVHED
jgi:transketolase